MIITLLIAALISFLVSYLQGQIDLVEPAIILAIVILNAVLGVFQEARARRSLEALKELSAPLALCLRGGDTKQIEAAALVPGDIILLESGHLVPADARLLTSLSLSVEESALTGETHPVEKTVNPLSDITPSLGGQNQYGFRRNNCRRRSGRRRHRDRDADRTGKDCRSDFLRNTAGYAAAKKAESHR